MTQFKKPIRLNVSKSLKLSDSVLLKEKRTDSPTCLSGHGALFVKGQTVSSTIANQSRRHQVSFSQIIASTKFMEKLRISKCHVRRDGHFKLSSTSGAVIVPDLSENQVAIKALKKFIAVNGFTTSVPQCDGHSGLLAFQEQVSRDMSLPTQVSPS